MMLTGLAEGAGLFWLATAGSRSPGAALGLLFVALLLARWIAWRIWRGRVAKVAPRRRPSRRSTARAAACNGWAARCRWH